MNSMMRSLALGVLTVALQSCGSVNSAFDVQNLSGNQDVPTGDTLESLELVEEIAFSSCQLGTVTYSCGTVSYGDHPLQNYELWLPNTRRPDGSSPLIVFIHSGGYYKGDKDEAYKPFTGMSELLAEGYTFATINYRLTGDSPFIKGITGEHPPAMRDAATALQDLRMRASSYGYDPERLALTGGSAGVGISLWLALHDDLKDASSLQLRDRFSTRASCLALTETQVSLHLGEVETLLAPYSHAVGLPAIYGLTPEQYNQDPEYYNRTLAESMHEASPISHLTADDDIRLMMTYTRNFGEHDIHSPEFGRYLQTGFPLNLKNQYNRTSFNQLGKSFEYKFNQRLNKPNVLAHLRSCFN